MARFLFWSDLHLEFRPFDLRAIDYSGVDGVLIAGDTMSKGRHLAVGREVIAASGGLPVVMVHGNHEAYGAALLDLLDKEKVELAAIQAAGEPLHVLHGAAVEIAGARIVGATLWSDFELDPAQAFQARLTAERVMNDYHAIRLGRGHYRPLRVADTIARHHVERRAIFDLLDTPFAGPTLVMTHHMPSRLCVSPRYANDPVSAAFASELLPEIRRRKVDAWIYGHSHDNLEFEVDGEQGVTRFLSNPRGYPGETTRFDPQRVVEL